MKGLPAGKLRELDNAAREIGLEERILIENAASNIFKVIDRLNLGKKALVVSGRGNNGADVLSCARKLLSSGYDLKVAVVSEKDLGPEAFFQTEILKKIGCRIYFFNNDNISRIGELFTGRDFILEGILGIGAKGQLSRLLRQTIDFINKSGKKVVSCDIPSGLSPDEGRDLGCAVRADYTVSFIAAKSGFFINQGPGLCGQIFIVDIGISREILEALMKKKQSPLL